MKPTRLLSIISLVGAFTACHGPQSILRPAGPAAGNLAQMGWVVFLLFSVITLIVVGILLFAVLRRTGSLETHAPWNEGGGHSWVWIGGFAIPLIVLGGLFVYTLHGMAEFPIHDGHQPHPDIQIIGHQWWWEIHYLEGDVSRHFVTANEIHIPSGRPMDIELESADVIHSFWVPALHGKMQLIPGKKNFIRIQAEQPGVYQGQCGLYCGEQHAHMRLLVVADEPDGYRAWFNQQLEPAVDPPDQYAQHGREVFQRSACSLCHTIGGTLAQGTVAPNLTHLASRARIAGNSYANNTANLEAWVTHAQSLKPGALMPNLTAFNGTDLQALVAYLQELK